MGSCQDEGHLLSLHGTVFQTRELEWTIGCASQMHKLTDKGVKNTSRLLQEAQEAVVQHFLHREL